MGYITADLDEDEAAYMNEKFKDYPDRNFKVGENRLDGWAAEEYARMRHSSNADNDYKRTARQRTVVSQVLERVKGMNVVQINALVDELLDKILTDMTNSDITTCITELLPLLPEMTMDSLQCPNADMDLSGKLIDLFKDGSPEQSIQTFTESYTLGLPPRRHPAALAEEASVPYRRHVIFPDSGIYRMAFTPAMPVRGVEAIGINQQKSE
mgnify:CR=1 FL=1